MAHQTDTNMDSNLSHDSQSEPFGDRNQLVHYSCSMPDGSGMQDGSGLTRGSVPCAPPPQMDGQGKHARPDIDKHSMARPAHGLPSAGEQMGQQAYMHAY